MAEGIPGPGISGVTHPFEFGAKVLADGDSENKLTVIGFLYVPNTAISVKCTYWCNGDNKEVWIDDWRLKVAT